MAQDMGDDLGELLMRWVARRAGEALRQYLANYQKNATEWTRQRFIENGMDPYRAQAEAQAAAAREAVCVPFGSAQDAALFAQMCRQDGVYAMPLTDPQGNGFLQFAVADLDRMQSSISQFAQEVARQHEQWIGETLRQPVSPEKLPQLREIPITDRPRTAPEQAPAQEHAAQAQETPSRTQTIAEKVKDARDHCANFEDFRQRLAEQGIGVTTTMTGELMFYEARMGADGQPLPFEHRQDWSVGADTLQKNYGVDARQDWFTRNRPTVSDGSLDQRGETPDLNQGIRSHDGMDTDTRTTRMEREQNGTDVPPSKVREENNRPYSFAGWYTDPECTQVFDFSAPVSDNITLYARWSQNPGTDEDPDQTTDPDQQPTGDGQQTDGQQDAQQPTGDAQSTQGLAQTGIGIITSVMSALALAAAGAGAAIIRRRHSTR